MDTALALMEAKEPVYPLDIVQAMRDQRASMVQNVVSCISMDIQGSPLRSLSYCVSDNQPLNCFNHSKHN